MRVDENGYDVGALKVINRLVYKPINPSYTSYTNSYTIGIFVNHYICSNYHKP